MDGLSPSSPQPSQPRPVEPERSSDTEIDLSAHNLSETSRSTEIVSSARLEAAAPREPEPAPQPDAEKGMLEETARAFGRDVHEAQSLDKVDKADSDVEKHFEEGRRTVDSPAHRAVWAKKFPVELFDIDPVPPSAQCAAAMESCKEALREHRRAGTLYGPDGKISPEVLQALSQSGYWGVLIDPAYGGQGASFHAFTRFLTEMAKIDPSTAGLSSVHGCIGAVDPLSAFGNEAQKARYLPLLASGQKLSGFALTEPGAGSDLTAVKTKAELVGDNYLVTGEKVFITNIGPGRLVGLVCLIENKPAVLVVDLPEKESESFRFRDYGLHALSHVWNRGMVFDKFAVPKENLLDPTKGTDMKGDGLTIAYHGLNRGRVALCANAAGTIAGLLAEVLPWAEQRITYAKAIGERQLVQSRLGHMAAQVVGCQAISEWCAGLLDKGYRGELECIVAKNFGSEAQKTVAIEDFMKTHGGRSFLKGHPFGDNVHDLLAPLIYEGEGDMLSMAFLKTLIKDHAERFFLPISQKVNELKTEGRIAEDFDMNKAKVGDLWKLREAILPYAKWMVGQKVTDAWHKWIGTGDRLPADMPDALRGHLKFAIKGLKGMVSKIDSQMQKYGPALADEQCTLVDLSREAQNLLMTAAVACWAAKKDDPVITKAADAMCQELKMRVTGGKPTARYHKTLASLGKDVLEDKFSPIEGVDRGNVQLRYDGLRKGKH